MKKFLKITGITLLVIIALLFLIPVLFKKQITDLVKKEINKSLTAQVDFNDVSLSLFRHFPKISISLDQLTVIGTGVFASDTLIAAPMLEVSADIISVIKGKDIKVSGIYLESPRIHALVRKDGQANWDITKPATDTSSAADTSASEFKLSLKKYAIHNGYLQYKDESSDINTEITGLDHEGSGDFTADLFTLATKTTAEEVNFTYAGIPYLVQTKTSIDADIEVDANNSKYSFKTEDILLNNLKLAANGFFQLVNDSSYGMDINFKTPANDFKDILSLVPAIYKTDFDKIKTTGQAQFNGFMKGTYSPQQLPAYDLQLAITNGSFQYPDLPKAVKNIQLALHASNTDGAMDNTVIDLSKGHLEMDNEPFDFRLLFRNPETAQYVDAAAKGKLDLSQVAQFVKLDKGTRLAGTVLADIFAKGNLSALSAQAGIFNAGGFFDIEKLLYASSAFPQPIQNANLKVVVENNGGIADNTTIQIPSGHLEVGSDPVDFTLQLKRPMTAIDFAGTAKGSFTLDNVKQFVSLDPGTALTGKLNADLSFAGTKAAIDKGAYDQVKTTGTAGISNLKYTAGDYPGGITIPVLKASFNPRTVSIDQFSGNYLQSNFTGNASINNMIGYAMNDEPLKGTANVAVDKMNLNSWMGTPEATTTAATSTAASTTSEPFLVPANLDLVLNAKAGEVQYDKVSYKNINGTLLLAGETVQLKDVKAAALDGQMTFNGSYSTRLNKKDPAIALSYDVKGLDIQKTFTSFNTVQALMPIAQFLAGKISSELTLTGNLHGDMMPDLGSLTGKGNLLLLEGVLRKFGPLEKVASTLQIDELKEITVKDIKNYIEIANGKVLVKPFTVKVKDIEMQIGGMHGLDKTIDYIIAMKVPRKYLGAQGNALLDNLAKQATNKGIPVDLGETVDLNIKVGGTMTNPLIKTDLKEVAGDAVADLKQQATDFAKAKIDSTKNMIRDSATAVKNQVVNDIREEIKNRILGKDSTGKTVNSDTTKKNAEKTIKNTINNLFKNKKPKTDSTKQ